MDIAYLAPNKNRHNNFTSAVGVTSNVSRELLYVRYNNGFLCGGSSAADSLAESNLLASGLSHEWAQQQKLVLGWSISSRDCYIGNARSAQRWWRDGRGEGGKFVIANIESSPVDRGGWRRKRSECVPKEWGDVGKVADRLLIYETRCSSKKKVQAFLGA